MPTPAPIPTALTADLKSLSEALDDPGTDITITLQRLSDNAQRAVSSYLGLRISHPGGGEPIELVLLPEPVPPVRASLRMSLTHPPTDGRPATAAAEIVLVLYAKSPGAFVDLAADLSWLTARPDAFELDVDLAAPLAGPIGSGLSALARQSIIDQALGALIGLGNTPEQAQDQLTSAAETAGNSRYQAALVILSELGPV